MHNESVQDDIPDFIEVENLPDLLEPGEGSTLSIRVCGNNWQNYIGMEAVFLDNEKNDRGKSLLSKDDLSDFCVGRFDFEAPNMPGDHEWSVQVRSEEQILLEHTIRIKISPHVVSMSLWNKPPAVLTGEAFSLTLGIKCVSGCDAKGWNYKVLDTSGHKVFEGQVGDQPWPETLSLYYANFQLTAPDQTGKYQWSIVACAPDGHLSHQARSIPLIFNVQPKPEATLKVSVFDGVDDSPVKNATVLVHPYRATTNSDGKAEIHLPRGPHTVVISGGQYFAYKSTIEVNEDTDLSARLYEDVEFTIADLWG